MICHLIFEHEYTQHFNDFIDRYFDIKNHVFIVYDHSSIGYKKEYKFKNSEYLPLNDDRCLAILRYSSAIIVHGHVHALSGRVWSVRHRCHTDVGYRVRHGHWRLRPDARGLLCRRPCVARPEVTSGLMPAAAGPGRTAAPCR